MKCKKALTLKLAQDFYSQYLNIYLSSGEWDNYWECLEFITWDGSYTAKGYIDKNGQRVYMEAHKLHRERL